MSNRCNSLSPCEQSINHKYIAVNTIMINKQHIVDLEPSVEEKQCYILRSGSRDSYITYEYDKNPCKSFKELADAFAKFG